VENTNKGEKSETKLFFRLLVENTNKGESEWKNYDFKSFPNPQNNTYDFSFDHLPQYRSKICY
jgi:hypothetical protein